MEDKNNNQTERTERKIPLFDIDFELERIRKEDEAKGKVYNEIIAIPKREEVARVERESTRINKEFFLKWYPTFFNVELTCHKIEIAKVTFYEWLKNDPLFAAAFYRIKMDRLGMVEDKLFQLILQLDGPSIRYFLDRHHPEYRPKSILEITPGGRSFTEVIWEDARKIAIEKGELIEAPKDNGNNNRPKGEGNNQ